MALWFFSVTVVPSELFPQNVASCSSSLASVFDETGLDPLHYKFQILY